MATDQEISQALHLLLRDNLAASSNPNKSLATTFASFDDVVRQLQTRLGLDLSHKVDFIRSQIQLLLQPHPLPQPHPHPPPQLQQPYSLLHGNDGFGIQQRPHFYPNQHHAAASSAIHSVPSQYSSDPPPAPAARPVEPPKDRYFAT